MFWGRETYGLSYLRIINKEFLEIISLVKFKLYKKNRLL